MQHIHYVEIENFKSFGKKIHIDLSHPAVLIGPNNSGKTSVIQALSLWSRGVKAWHEKRGSTPKKESLKRISAPINRLNILDVPVADARFLWSGTHPNKERMPVKMVISVGIIYEKSVRDCRFIFTYQNHEVIYCKPEEKILREDKLIQHAANLQFHLLYPMSGIMSNVSAETEETPLADGRINLLLGQGQTAQVLRNICFKVVEQDAQSKSADWEKITEIMKQVFLVTINKPFHNQVRGSLVMTYRQEGIETDFDISLAGRGLQQVLLILAYLHWHKNSILMIDEPDAHLEILRQKQIFAILNTIIHNNHGQVIIATHAEAILDEALENNLILLLQGEATNLAKHQDVISTLRDYGVEHYYKARTLPRILYIEGNTDIEILRAFAKHLRRADAENVLNAKLNIYYTQNIEPENTLSNQLDRIGGAFKNYRPLFQLLKKQIPELKALGVFDSDNKFRQDEIDTDIAILYWKNYEIENYFITPQVLIAYATSRIGEEQGPLFQSEAVADFRDAVDEVMKTTFFDGDTSKMEEYSKMPLNMQRTLLKTILPVKKASKFAEYVFKQYSEKTSSPLLLAKSEFYRMVPFCPVEEISAEVNEKLNMLVEYLKYSTA